MTAPAALSYVHASDADWAYARMLYDFHLAPGNLFERLAFAAFGTGRDNVTEVGYPEPDRGPLQVLHSPGPVREPGMAAPHVPGHTMTMAFTGRTNHVAVSCCCRPKGDHLGARPVLPAQEAYRLWLEHVKRAAAGVTA